MTHLPFIAAAYAVALLIPAGFALAARHRLARAQARLRALDPRAARAPQDSGAAR